LRKKNIFTYTRARYGTTAFYIMALADETVLNTCIFDAFPIPVS